MVSVTFIVLCALMAIAALELLQSKSVFEYYFKTTLCDLAKLLIRSGYPLTGRLRLALNVIV